MTTNHPDSTVGDPTGIADNSRNERSEVSSKGQIFTPEILDNTAIPDRISVWMERYLTFAVTGVRSPAVATKIALHLSRFRKFFEDAYGHDRLSICLQRDAVAWQRELSAQGLAPATVNE